MKQMPRGVAMLSIFSPKTPTGRPNSACSRTRQAFSHKSRIAKLGQRPPLTAIEAGKERDGILDAQDLDSIIAEFHGGRTAPFQASAADEDGQLSRPHSECIHEVVIDCGDRVSRVIQACQPCI